MSDREFIIYLKKYIPTRSRFDDGVDFNLKQLHFMIEKHLEEE